MSVAHRNTEFAEPGVHCASVHIEPSTHTCEGEVFVLVEFACFTDLRCVVAPGSDGDASSV
jgi:hypothetical protein